MEDLHRIVTRQNVLIGRFGIPKEEVPQVQQAQPIKKDNGSSDAAADPRTVLLSHLGNGSGGSHPSTDQGSWPQVCICVFTKSSVLIPCPVGVTYACLFSASYLV